MPDHPHSSDRQPAGDVAAGRLAVWLDGMRRAIAGHDDADVPCGSCVGCCSSSQFVLIGPDEDDALAHIPPELLFPAPRKPTYVLMGYDEQGRCPMLGEHGCSIYAHRPRTCRTYDCRVLAAAGVADRVDDKPLIVAQAMRWRFELGSANDRVLQHAVVAAASYLERRRAELPGDVAPLTTTHVAVAAVMVHDLFLQHGDEPSPEQVTARLRTR